MENIELINLHRARDFGSKINATFEFIKRSFKPLIKSLLLIAGPSMVMLGVLVGTTMGEMMSSLFAAPTNPEIIETYFMSVNYWLQILLVMVFMVISTVMTISTVNNYIKLYDEKQTYQIEVKDVWDRVRASFWMYLGTTVLLYILMIVAFLVAMIPMFLLAAMSPFLMFIGFPVFIVGFFYVIIAISLTYFIRTYENLGFFDAIMRSHKLIQGKWWSTFGLLVVLFMIGYAISAMIGIPFQMFLMGKMVHSVEQGGMPKVGESFSWGMALYFAFYYLIALILYTLPNFGIAFQYFNLVEMKEARGLISQIDTVGQGPVSNPEEEQY